MMRPTKKSIDFDENFIRAIDARVQRTDLHTTATHEMNLFLPLMTLLGIRHTWHNIANNKLHY